MQLLGYDTASILAESLVWMRANQDLAGWAQAVGATIAVLIAIAVPAYQRHAQLLDMKRQQAGVHLALASMGQFLVNDVVIYLEGVLALSGYPRRGSLDTQHINDLLERIRALEGREISHARIVSLYAARGALTLTARNLSADDLLGYPLSEGEIKNLKVLISGVKYRHAIAKYDADFSLGRMRSAEAFGLGRPIAKVITSCWAFFKHRNLPIKDRWIGIK